MGPGYGTDISASQITRRQGFGVRLSANGYMDCTDWIVCDTELECFEELLEMYPPNDSD